MNAAGYLKPDRYIVAFGVLGGVNASFVWGGVFSLLPSVTFSPEFFLLCFLCQTICFALSIPALGCLAFFRSRFPARAVLGTATTLYLAAMLLIALTWRGLMESGWAAMLSGSLLGFSNLALNGLWMMYFSSRGIQSGTRSLVLSGIYAALSFALMAFIPQKLGGFLIPVVAATVASCLLSRGLGSMDTSLSMFADRAADYRSVYVRAFKDSWRSILYLGALASCSGALRAYCVTPLEQGRMLSLLSMAVSAIPLVAILFTMRKKDTNLNTASIYQLFFPVLITGFLLLPLFSDTVVFAFSIIVHIVFVTAEVLMTIQCLQLSHNRGLNPMVIYSVCLGAVSLAHNIGFLGMGLVRDFYPDYDVRILSLCLICLFVLAMTFFFGQEKAFLSMTHRSCAPENIELLAPLDSRSTASYNRAKTFPRLFRGSERTDTVVDRSVARSEVLGSIYGLSEREREIVVLLAQGNGASQIADKLYISENTVRTHIRRIYGKTSVHKKQELINLLQDIPDRD